MRTYEVELDGKPLSIQYGVLARQANGAVTVRQGETVVLVTACMAEPREGIDFFPLTIDYEERLYSVGRIPGGFPRREGRASNDGILAMRLTDRPLRPLFPKGFRNEVQVVAMTLSADQEHQPDTLITVGASAALMISNIPFGGPVSSVRVARINGEYVVNPTFAQSDESDLDIIVAGTDEAVVMVEAGARGCPEDAVLEAIEKAMEANRAINALQRQMAEEANPTKAEFTPAVDNEEAITAVTKHLAKRIDEVVATAASERSDANKALKRELVEKFVDKFSEKDLSDALYTVIKRSMRKRILEKDLRADGRNTTQIRDLDIHVGVLPRTHGSGLFTRGETQVLTIATLGSLSMAQKLDTLSPKDSKRFLHHYNFPPYSVGEVRPMRGASRRDIGHGALAERALEAVLPDDDAFPYVIRLVSETMSSNGSTSMASVCGSTLALMDAGVPIQAPVAGIAMGLIMGDDGKYKVLTDIAGQEDFMGDMDFKVAGTADGITALQMDIKIGGVSHELLEQVLAQAREARLEILRAMHEVIEAPRESVSVYAPKMTVIQIKTDQIGLIIGPGGKMIRKIQEESGGTSIDIEEDGTVVVGGVDSAAVDRAVAMIQGLTKEVTVGEIYTGPVTRLLNFGAFVEILPGKEGLVHISELSDEHVDRVEDVANVGDQLTVMVTEIDNLGRVNLSVRAAASGEIPAPTGDRGGRGGGGRPRGRRDNGGGGGDRGGDRDRGPRPADRGGDRAPRDFDGGDRRGGRRGGGGGGGGGGAGRGRSGPGGGGDFQRSDRSPSLGGASRGWTRRANPPADENAPPAPPPPPRRGFGGFGSYDE